MTPGRRPFDGFLRLMVGLMVLVFLPVQPASAFVYLYQHYSESDGLPNNQVNDVAQDTEGYMWFTTRGGIVRYDGLEWWHQTRGDGLLAEEYSHLLRGPQGRLWAVSTRAPFCVQYRQDGRWEGLELPPIPRINGLAYLFDVSVTAEGELLVCLAVHGGPLCFYTQGEWRFIVDHRLASPAYAHVLMDGQLYVSNSAGLFQIDPLRLTVMTNPFPEVPPGPLFVLEPDPVQDLLWLVGEDWVGRRSAEGFEYLAQGLELTPTQPWEVTGALVDREGGLYFGGLNRALRFDPDLGLEELGQQTGREGAGATNFFQDREGNLWISSLRGVDRLVSRRFAGLNRSQGLLTDEVTAVLEDHRGNMVFGHERGLTWWGDTVEALEFDLPQDQLTRVMGLAEDSRNNLWVATDGSGLRRFDALGGKHRYGPAQGMPTDRLFAVHVGPDDRVWVGTFQGLLVGGVDGFESVKLPGQDQDEPTFIRRIQAGADGALYLATGKDGIIRYREGAIKIFKGESRHRGNSTFGMCETRDGRIWVGSIGGLFTLEGDSLVASKAPDPVLERPIYAIEEDQQGRVWFGTDAGVFIWDGQELTHYGVDQGLLGSEINRAALLPDSRGQFWVGTDRGVSVYRPWQDLPRSAPPILKIQSFEVEGRLFPVDSPLRLGRPPHSLIVHFRGLSYTDEKHTRFRTWLSPFEETWSPLSHSWINQVRYTNLPAGEYEFKVQMIHSDGSSSTVVSAPSILIQPPLARRWWVLLGLALLVGGSGYLAIVTWEGRRYRHRLEGEVLARTNELAESERTLRRESQRLSATLGSILDGVLALDEDNQVVLCNPAAERILNCSEEAMVGRSFAEVMPLNQGQVLPTDSGVSQRSVQDRLDCPRRGTISLEISSATVTDSEGRRTGSVVAFRDITDRLRMERELIHSQKLESLGLLAGGIAHDFNNLLTIMLGNLDLLAYAPHLNSEDQECVQLAKQASKRARSLTEQLLTFARGGAPLRQLQPLGPIIEQSVALSFSGTGARCEVDLPRDLWPVDVDAGQMSQVFNNLFINAAQAMAEGGVARVTGTNLPEAPEGLSLGSWIRIDIRDEGPGISDGDLIRIFDPYFTTKAKGTGLGLATAFSIVSRHGGHLAVESVPGEGAVFRVFLPRGLGEKGTIPLPDAHVAVPKARVLVLEDEAGIQALLRRQLNRLGLEAVITADGVETVKHYSQAMEEGHPFDVVLTDLTIPGGQGGRRTLEQLKVLDPDVRAVVVSGYSHEDILANFQDHGFQGALAKPFGIDQLRAVLARVLG
jgi:PAS domain S-box-containing protein